ncbi:MAG: proline--tRNA ligase [Frankiaceae bacterium]
MSSLLLRTLREDPADAEAASDRLLTRAGYVRRSGSGSHAWLPLGKRTLDRITAVAREEMAAIGGQEVLLPALAPIEAYERTGRLAGRDERLLRVRDRRGADHVLGAAHEEALTLLAQAECTSYRDLPVTLFQVRTTFRDEVRSRGGVLRGRELLTKDSCSFDLDDEGLGASCAAHRAAYLRTFERLGLDVRVATAVPEAMGGGRSEKLLAPAAAGEDAFVSCAACGHAADVEAVTTKVPPVPLGDAPPLELLDTPGTPTIEALAAAVGVPAAATLKNLLVTVAEPDGTTYVAAVGVPGDREVDLRRLEAALAPAAVRIFAGEDFAGRPDLVRGYVGPQGMAGRAFRYLADPRVAPGTSWVTGANRVDTHARGVVCGRDFAVDRYVDVASVLPGDPCPRCSGPVTLERGIEVGHVRALGRRYADALGFDVAGPDGRPVRVTMGSYGIGVSRLVAAIAEQHHDEAGLAWPPVVAPAQVTVLPIGKGDLQRETAGALAGSLAAAGLDVLLDDRPASPGEKFADADLIGTPLVVVAGRSVADGTVEVKWRGTGRREPVRVDECTTTLSRWWAEAAGTG